MKSIILIGLCLFFITATTCNKPVIFGVAGVPQKICDAAGGITNSNGVCTCPANTIVNENSTLCVSSPATNNMPIVIASPATPSTCNAAGGIVDYFGTQCVCVGNTIPNADKSACITQNEAKSVLIVQPSEGWSLATCVAANGSFKPDTKECFCIGDWIPNANKTACITQKNDAWTADNCAAVNGTFDEASQSCNCTGNWVPNADQTACIDNSAPPAEQCYQNGCVTGYIAGAETTRCCDGTAPIPASNCVGDGYYCP